MLIASIVEQVVVLQRHIVRIFITKNQINPLIDFSSDIRRLEYLSHFENKLLWVSCPTWQFHIVDLFFILFNAQIYFVPILQELGPVIKLRDQLFIITSRSLHCVKLISHCRE